jgi:hypothetical protein
LSTTTAVPRSLACVHDRFWLNGNHYHDPWDGEGLRETKKFRDHIELMRTKKRVIVTSNETNLSRRRGHAQMKRVGYRGVFNIDNFVFNDAGMDFDFIGGIPRCGGAAL